MLDDDVDADADADVCSFSTRTPNKQECNYEIFCAALKVNQVKAQKKKPTTKVDH